MSNQKKRPYSSETRRVQAAQTRNRILLSARELFQEEGFEAVTIEKIAHLSDVSIPTVYALFQSKRGILRTLMDLALPKEKHDALVEKVYQEKSVKKRLLLAAQISRQLYDAERSQLDLFRGAEVLAPEFKELEKEREERRYKRLEKSIKIMAEEKVLPKELSISKAHDIFWTFTGHDIYRMLVIDQGWASEEYEQWLGQTLIKMLLREELKNPIDTLIYET
ncbi:MAG: TetR/AcrR family transcriptional regulator [Proteobacteria bacterium]|nr:TetR/AcrR family transcriptional regulator [Pseudomonadota bacterium]